MPNYQNSKIYTIRSHQTELMYIGSTTQHLSTRLAGHRRDFKKWKNGKKNYTTSFELLKYDDAYIELLLECKCENRQQLCAIEGQFIRRCKVAANKNIPGRTGAEYYQDHKEEIKAHKKQYRQANKQQIAAQQKQWYLEHREELKAKHNQYYDDHKEECKAYKKQWYQDHKQEAKQYYQANKDKFVCYECDFWCNSNSNLTQHKKTKAHLAMVNFLIECGGENYNNVE